MERIHKNNRESALIYFKKILPQKIQMSFKYLMLRRRKIWGDHVFIGSNTVISSTSILSDDVYVGPNGSVTDSKIGLYSYIGQRTIIQNASIGNFCSISWNVTIGPDMHPINYLSTHLMINKFSDEPVFDTQVKRIEIGNDVWIGCNVVVMPGVKIGDGAIVGSSAVVTKDVPPFAIVVGVPAHVIRYRFEEDVIERLLSIKWWELPERFIKENIDLFQKPMTKETLDLLEMKIKKN
ncbi:MAG: CatB-related O-acetyltransferase [Athalassotoga sp.]